MKFLTLIILIFSFKIYAGINTKNIPTLDFKNFDNLEFILSKEENKARIFKKININKQKNIIRQEKKVVRVKYLPIYIPIQTPVYYPIYIPRYIPINNYL